MDDRLLFAWGSNSGGQLGSGHTCTQLEPMVIEFFKEHSVMDVAGGELCSYAVLENGEVYEWGDILRKGGRKRVLTPRLLRSMSGVPVRQAAVGARHVMLLTDNSDVYTWGYGEHGQLGHGVAVDEPDPRLCELLSGKGVISISCGGDHSAVCTSLGDVFTFGKGKNGRLGHRNDDCPQLTPKFVVNMRHRKGASVHCGEEFTAILTTDGTIAVFGDNSSGQLGIGSTKCARLPTDVTALGQKVIKRIGCGLQHMAAITDNGDIFTWGLNTYGQLGHGDNTKRLVPHEIVWFRNNQVVDVQCGGHFTTCRNLSGEIYSWGIGKNGQLGRKSQCADSNEPLPMTTFRNMQVQTIRCGWNHVFAITYSSVYQITKKTDDNAPIAEIESHVGPSHLLQWDSATAVPIHCCDARSTSAGLYSPGGHPVEFLLLVDQYEQYKAKQFTFVELVLLFHNYLRWMPQPTFNMHTDKKAVDNLRRDVDRSDLDIRNPPERICSSLLTRIDAPENVGCDILQRMMLQPEFGVRRGLVENFVRAFYQVLWDPEHALNKKVHLEIYDGDRGHNHDCFVSVTLGEQTVTRYLHPLLTPTQPGLQVMYYHPEATTEVRVNIHQFLKEKYDADFPLPLLRLTQFSNNLMNEFKADVPVFQLVPSAGDVTTVAEELADLPNCVVVCEKADQGAENAASAQFVKEAIGDPTMLRWTNEQTELFCIACSDSRNADPLISTFGGHAGEFLTALNVYEKNIGSPVREKDVESLFRLYLERMTVSKFYMHIDQQAIEELATAMGCPVNIAAPNPRFADVLLDMLCDPKFVSCEHLRTILYQPAKYNIREELVKSFIRTYYRVMWDKQTPSLQEKIYLHIDTARRVPSFSATVAIECGSQHVDAKMYPFLPTQTCGGKLIRFYHLEMMQTLRRDLAQFFCDGVKGMSAYVMETRMKDFSSIYMSTTLDILQPKHPVYTAFVTLGSNVHISCESKAYGNAVHYAASMEETEDILGDFSKISWNTVDNTGLHAAEIPSEDYVLGTMGGTFAEFLAALNVYEKMIECKLTNAQVEEMFLQFINAMPTLHFSLAMHTTTWEACKEALRNRLIEENKKPEPEVTEAEGEEGEGGEQPPAEETPEGEEGEPEVAEPEEPEPDPLEEMLAVVDSMDIRSPPKEHQRDLIKLIGENFLVDGSSYLELFLKYPHEFGVRPGLFKSLLRAFFRVYWDHSFIYRLRLLVRMFDITEERSRLQNTAGTNRMRAVVNVRSGEQNFDLSAIAMAPSGPLLVQHPDAVNSFRQTVAQFFSTCAELEVDAGEFMNRISDLCFSQNQRASKSLGFGLPVYTATLTQLWKPAFEVRFGKNMQIVEDKPGQGLNKNDVLAHFGDATHLNWEVLGEQPYYCTEGRCSRPLLGTPGGHAGEFLVALQAFEVEMERELAKAEVIDIFKSYLSNMKAEKFFMHTDLAAVENLREISKKPALDLKRIPAFLHRFMLGLITEPRNVGCSHIRQMLTNPERCHMRAELVRTFLRVFFEILWNDDDPFQDKLEYLVYERPDNEEQAVVTVKTTSLNMNRGVFPLVRPMRDQSAVHVHTPQPVEFLRDELSKFFSKRADGRFGRQSLKEKMQVICNVQKDRILKTLCKKMPQYTLTVTLGSKVKITQERAGSGFDSERALLALPPLKQIPFVDFSSICFTCSDGGVSRGTVSTPGGHTAEFVMALSQFEKTRESLLDEVLIKTMFEEYLDVMPYPCFYLHGERSVIQRIASGLGLNFDYVMGLITDPNSEFQQEETRDILVEEMCKPENIGCQHLRNMASDGYAYTVREELITSFLRVYLNLLFDRRNPLSSRLMFEVCDTVRDETGIVIIETDDVHVQAGRVPVVAPRTPRFSVLMYNDQEVNILRAQLAEFASFYSEDNIESSDILRELDRIGKENMERTFRKILPGRPVFKATLT